MLGFGRLLVQTRRLLQNITGHLVYTNSCRIMDPGSGRSLDPLTLAAGGNLTAVQSAVDFSVLNLDTSSPLYSRHFSKEGLIELIVLYSSDHCGLYYRR